MVHLKILPMLQSGPPGQTGRRDCGLKEIFIYIFEYQSNNDGTKFSNFSGVFVGCLAVL